MGLLDSIFHHWNVLPTVDHRRLLELCRGFEFPEPINPPPNSYYKIHGLRSQVLLEPYHGEIFNLVHKAHIRLMPVIYDDYKDLSLIHI